MNRFIKISDKDYFSVYKDWMNQSSFKSLLKSYRHYLSNNFKSTAAMTEGKLLHSLILEEVSHNFLIVPDDIKKRAGKKWETWIEENKDDLEHKEAIFKNKFEDFLINYYGIKESLNRTGFDVSGELYDMPLLEIIESAQNREISAFFEFDSDFSPFVLNSIVSKIKIDVLYNNETLFDLKFVDDSGDDWKWQKKVIDFGYYIQQYYYRYGVSKVTGIPIDEINFYFILIEKKEPYGITYRQLSHEWDYLAKHDIEKALKTYIEHRYLHEELQPAYKEHLLTTECPEWLRSQYE